MCHEGRGQRAGMCLGVWGLSLALPDLSPTAKSVRVLRVNKKRRIFCPAPTENVALSLVSPSFVFRGCKIELLIIAAAPEFPLQPWKVGTHALILLEQTQISLNFWGKDQKAFLILEAFRSAFSGRLVSIHTRSWQSLNVKQIRRKTPRERQLLGPPGASAEQLDDPGPILVLVQVSAVATGADPTGPPDLPTTSQR